MPIGNNEDSFLCLVSGQEQTIWYLSLSFGICASDLCLWYLCIFGIRAADPLVFVPLISPTFHPLVFLPPPNTLHILYSGIPAKQILYKYFTTADGHCQFGCSRHYQECLPRKAQVCRDKMK